MIKKVIKILVFSMFILLTGCFGKEDTKELNEAKLKQLTKIISDIQEYKKQNTRTITGEILDGIYVKSDRGYDYYNLNKLKSMTFQEKAELFDKLDLASGESYVSIGNKTKLFFAYVDLADLSATGTDGTTTIGLKTVVYNMEIGKEIYADGSEIPEGMVLVPAGTTSADNGNITVSNNFYIGKYEVTQAEWQAVMGNNPSSFAGKPNNPVECVSWYDVVEYCNARSIQEGLTPYYTYTKVGDNNLTNVDIVIGANGYRLPTDAEWEYAARGGAGGSATTYAGSNNLEDVAWYWDNNETNGEIYGTKAVGRKLPNELGIYDMSGNVFEWCYDWYPGYEGSYRILRGGSWYYLDNLCTVSHVHYYNPNSRNNNYGFRLARNTDTILVSLSNITIKTQVEKTTYIVGETFSTSGLEIEATMSDGSKKSVTGWTTSTPDMSTSGTKIVIVSYSEAGVTKSVKVNIQVTPEGMVLVPAGTTSADNGNITVSNNFYIGKYEVTQAEWQAVMGNNPSYFSGNPNNPVEQVSWYDVVEYCNARSIQEGLTPYYTYTKVGDNNLTNVDIVIGANGYRLPTDVEWEYAARGGAGGSATTYSGSNNIEEVAWYWNNNETNGEIYGTKAVGRKLPNELGIYDMSGNVWEWCYDWYPGYEGSSRILRGGGWGNNGSSCTVSYVPYDSPNLRFSNLGFRVCRLQ